MVKISFFGDPKQCMFSTQHINMKRQLSGVMIVPPYDQDAAPDLKCIFDVKHLAAASYFLNIQCTQMSLEHYRAVMSHMVPADRMPTPLGQFISRTVYDKFLHSRHWIKSDDCIAFVDVAHGEEASVGTSKKVMTLPNMSKSCLTFDFTLV